MIDGQYRNTYALINLTNLKKNIQSIIKKSPGYKYYMGVVKADCYGHGNCIKTIIEAGCNYLAVSSLEEALIIRKEHKNIPILCLGPVKPEFLYLCRKNAISVTISSLDYLKLVKNIKNLRIHLKIDTGMNRLGFKNKEDFKEAFELLKNNIEGIFTHIYYGEDKERTNNQFKKFKEIISSIDYSKIPMIHVFGTEGIWDYPKLPYTNGIRIGQGMFGMLPTNKFKIETTFTLHSEVIEVKEVKKGEDVGYGARYVADKDTYVAIIPIGYVDGIIRTNRGRDVYINNKPYPIIGSICMDMLMVSVDESVKIFDKVDLIKDRFHLYEIVEYNNTCAEEIICIIGKRVPRIYKEN